MMKSPFPGMDPFLEVNPRWEGFHNWFVRELARQSMPQAEELGCWIDVERTIYHQAPTGEVFLIGEPDEAVGIDLTLDGDSSRNHSSGDVALLDPKVVHEVVLDPETLERVRHDYIVVRELGQFNRILAVVEVLSPANKSGSYRKRYREKRRTYLESRAHFMEIDLLRGGDNPARQLFPEIEPTPYFIFVARKTPTGRKEEAYPLRLQDPLPVIGLPIGPPRPDLPLDLASAFQSAYRLSVRRGSIDHAKEPIPPPPLSDSDAAWVRSLLSRSV